MKNELSCLRETSSKLDYEISKVCKRHGFGIGDFYRAVNKMPIELIDEAMPLIEKQHETLSMIFDVKNGNPKNIIHLADFR